MYYIKRILFNGEPIDVDVNKRFDFTGRQFGYYDMNDYTVYDANLIFEVGATETDRVKSFTFSKFLDKFTKSEDVVIDRLIREHDKYNEDKEFWRDMKDSLDEYDYKDEVFRFYRGELNFDVRYDSLHNNGCVFDWLSFLFIDVDCNWYVNVIPYMLDDAGMLLISYITNVLYATYILEAYFKGKSLSDIFIISEYLTNVDRFKHSWLKSKVLLRCN